MAGKTSNWLLGCGIGCAVIIIGGVVLGTMGFMFMRDTFKGFSTAADSRQTIEERFGTPDDYTPPADGVIPPDRMAIFLAVREATQPVRLAIAGGLAAFPMNAEQAKELESKPFLEKITKTFSIGRAAMGMAGDMGRLFETRNRVLLEEGMGMGEYTWIYVIAYDSWLGHDLSDAPAGSHIRFEKDDPGSGTPEHPLGDLRLLSRIHGNLLSMLRNQLAAVPADPGQDAWRQELEAQIAAMESSTKRIPWQEGLPAPIAASLEPYRERLEATYSPAVNQFELARNRRSGRFSVQAD